MATPDRVPAEENVERGQGPQVTAREARELAARDGTIGGAGNPTSRSERAAADRDVSGRAFGRADAFPGDAARGASGGAGNARRDESAADEAPFSNAETALGGADTVQKTTYGVGHGGEPLGTQEYAPVGLRKGEGAVVARSSVGGGVNPVVWIVALLALIAVVVYGAGLFGG